MGLNPVRPYCGDVTGTKIIKSKKLPNVEYLLECFLHDKEHGVLIWRNRPAAHFSSERIQKKTNTEFSGRIAGRIRADGYAVVKLNGELYKIHRIIWKLEFGNDPSKYLDHINGAKSDNRLENLREADAKENRRNSRGNANSTTGLKGSSFINRNKKYVSQISVDGKKYFLGYFETPEEAHSAYMFAAKSLHKEFAYSGLS